MQQFFYFYTNRNKMTLNFFVTENQAEIIFSEGENIKTNLNFFLNFFYDVKSQELYNSLFYRMFWLENKDDFFSEIFNIILGDKILKLGENEQKWSYFFDKVLNNVQYQPEYINLFMLENHIEVSKKIENYLKNRYNTDVKTYNLADYAVKNMILALSLQVETENLALIVADGTKIHLYSAGFDGRNIKTNYSKTLVNTNFSPFIQALATEILNNIQRIYSVKLTAEQQTDAIEYLSLKLHRIEDEIKANHKDFLVFSTRLPIETKRFIVRINMQTVEILKDKILKDLIADIYNSANINKNAKIVLLGEFNSTLQSELQSYFDDLQYVDFQRVVMVKDVDIEQFFEENKTVFEESESEEDDVEKLDSLDISSDLDIGWQVKLHTFDPRPDKGEAMQFLEYLGDKKFVVIDSTRSLKTGDVAESTIDIWQKGDAIIFNIYRSGKLFARFKTRSIKQIEIIREKN